MTEHHEGFGRGDHVEGDIVPPPMLSPAAPAPPQSTLPHWGAVEYPTPHTVARKSNGMAVASLVLGISGVLVSWFLLGIPSILAVIFGHVALRQTKRDPNQSGRGMAIAGLVLGYVIVASAAVVLVVFVLGSLVSASFK